LTWWNSDKTRKVSFAVTFTEVRAPRQGGRKGEIPGNCTALLKQRKEEEEGKMFPILQMGGRTERAAF